MSHLTLRVAFVLALALLAAACAPAAPSPTAAPAKPTEAPKPAATAAPAKPTEAPAAKPTEAPAAKPAEKAAAGPRQVMKIGFATVNDIQHEWAKRMKDRLERRTNGQFDVQLFPSSQLGNNQRMLEGVQLGTIEATIQPPEFMSGFEPRYQIGALPFLFDTMDEAYKVLTRPEISDEFLSLAKDKGVQGVGYFIYGPAGIQAHFPIRHPDDLRGKKIRVLGAPVEVDTMAAFGAAGVPMPLDAVITGLQQRTIDGVQTAAMVATPFKFFDLVKYYNNTGHYMITTLAVVSAKWLSGLPADLQKAVIEESGALKEEMFKFASERNAQDQKAWKDRPQNEFVDLTPQERKAFQDRVGPVYEKFLKDNPNAKPLLDKIQAEIKRVRGG